MTNIFSLFSQAKVGYKTQTTSAKILAWFLAFSITMQGVAVPLVAAADIDLSNLASTTQAIIDNANNNNSNNNANLNALLGGLNTSNTPPIITPVGSLFMFVTQGGTYTEPGATVVDLEDGDITSKLVISGTVDVNTVGSYTITYNATDSKNLPALGKQRNVTVIASTTNNGNNGNGITITYTGGSTTGNGTSNSNANASSTCSGSSSSTNTDVSSSGNGSATGSAGTYTSNSGCGNASTTPPTTPPTTPQPPATTTPVIKDISCTDTHNVQEGWYAQYYNYSKNDSEMEANAVSGPHIDPLNPSWTSHWYDTQYFRTGKIDNNLQFGENFFPFDTQAEEWMMGGYGTTTWHEFHFGAHWSAIATVSTTTDAAVTLTSDDDAWIYVDGVLALNNGGLHAPQTVTGTLHLTGSNRIDIYYAERHTVRAHMSFAFNTTGVHIKPFKAGCELPPPPPPNTNQPPVITLVGSSTMSVLINTVFTDPGATATDPEDGARPVVATGTVNTSATGTYTIIYNATDTQGLAATSKTRTVNVVPKNQEHPACSDGLDNDNDGKIDYPADIGCDSPNDNDENNRPVITLVGSSTIEILLNTAFTDPGATAFDAEDGTITPKIVATGTVNTFATGTYTITYNATDSKNLAATPVVRTVKVNPLVTECNDGKDNDGDNKIDYPADSGCDSSIDNDENSAPVITVTSPNPMSVILGSVFTDPFATALDAEDGTITPKIMATGTVNTSVLGTYTITYNATDSKNLAATTKTRTVNVVSAPNEGCQSNCGGGGGGGCSTNCNGDCTANCTPPPPPPTGCSGNCGGGGGGSVLPITLTITNEKLTVTGTTTVTITWDTNQPSDSRVVYGIDPVQTLGTSTTYGYSLTTATVPALVTSHSLSISGVPSAIVTYYRPVSSDGVRTAVGIELNRTPAVVAGACTYLRDYMRLGISNDPSEVTKLQSFLHNEEGFTDLAITGTFDITTDRAVRVFQDRYKADVLDSWNLPANTGYVYYTTKKKINELHCKSLFPLTGEQQAEIDAFRNLINGFTQNGAPVAVTPGSVDGTVLGAATSRTAKNRFTETKSENDMLASDATSSSFDASSTSATSTHIALTTRAKHLFTAAVGGLAGFAHISRGAAVVLIALMCAFIAVSVALYRRRAQEDDLANFIQDAEEIED